MYLVSLFDFIPTMKLRHANYSEIPARSTSHVSREGAVLDLSGGERERGIGDFRKNILKSDFEHEKVL